VTNKALLNALPLDEAQSQALYDATIAWLQGLSFDTTGVVDIIAVVCERVSVAYAATHVT
jgi:hypothetical protein